MNVLVTGAAGGIGSHLCQELIRQGHTVTGIDNFCVGQFRAPYIHNIDVRYLTFVDDHDIVQLKHALRPKFDWIFHLAALADIVPSVDEPQKYHSVNVSGTVNMLEYARRTGVSRFVYAASGSCYGDTPPLPTREDAPLNPRYPYALTKLMGEQYVLHYAKLYGMGALSLRLFNVFGPGFRTAGTYGAVFGVFLAQLAQGSPFTIVGDGTQRRDFTYVSSVVDALIRAAESDVSGVPINIGSGGSYTINSLVSYLSPRHPRVNIPRRAGEPEVTWADTNRAKELLNWACNVSFGTGITAMLKELSAYQKAPLWTPELISEATKGWHACVRS